MMYTFLECGSDGQKTFFEKLHVRMLLILFFKVSRLHISCNEYVKHCSSYECNERNITIKYSQKIFWVWERSIAEISKSFNFNLYEEGKEHQRAKMRRICKWRNSGQTVTQILTEDARTDGSSGGTALFEMMKHGDTDALPTERAETPALGLRDTDTAAVLLWSCRRFNNWNNVQPNRWLWSIQHTVCVCCSVFCL